MGIRILMVEDEANIADYLVRGLREEGYVVEHAGLAPMTRRGGGERNGSGAGGGRFGENG